MRKTRLSAAVALVLIGGASGCRQDAGAENAAVRNAKTKEEERAERDGVPVSQTAQSGHHFSPFYGGYVPFIVPLGGYGGGMSYRSQYSALPPDQRSAYPPPRTGADGFSSPTSPSRTTSTGGVSRGGFGSTGHSSSAGS